MNKKTKKDAGPGKAIAIASAVAAIVIVIVILLLLLRSCGAPANDPGGIEFDPSATEGGWDEADMDAIRDSLNEKVEEGMINISMNTSPVFSDGESAGSLMIVNDDIIPTIGSVGDSTGEAGVFSLDGVTQDQWDSMNIGDCFMTLIMSVICLLFGLVAFVLGFAMCYVRAWQIYIYAAFSPIPISLLGFEETRQMGIGFLKNFASVCLAGAILLFLFVAYPFVLAGSVSSLSAGNDILFLMTTSSADSLINLLKGVAISVVLIFMIVKSGGIAKRSDSLSFVNSAMSLSTILNHIKLMLPGNF